MKAPLFSPISRADGETDADYIDRLESRVLEQGVLAELVTNIGSLAPSVDPKWRLNVAGDLWLIHGRDLIEEGRGQLDVVKARDAAREFAAQHPGVHTHLGHYC